MIKTVFKNSRKSRSPVWLLTCTGLASMLVSIMVGSLVLGSLLLAGCKDSLLTPIMDDIKEAEEHTWSYTVSFNSGVADTPANPASITVAKPATTVQTLPSDPARNGYSFGGWWTGEAGAGSGFTLSTKVTGDLTVYAKWTANQYTVSFDSHDGSPVDDMIITFGSTYGELPESSRNGYYFAGWFTAGTGGSQISASTIVATAADHTLHAQWSQVPIYQVDFDANGGSAVLSQAIPEGGFVTKPDDPILTGHSLAGWYREAGHVNEWLFETEQVTSTITLHAKWTPNTYSVSFDKQSGTGGSSSVIATYGLAMPTATAPVRTGYTFGGYFTSSAGEGTQYYNAAMASSRNWDLASDTEQLYAAWTVNQYNLSYDGNGADGGEVPAAGLFNYETEVTVASPGNMTKSGYIFTGWNTQSNGGGSGYAPTGTLQMPATDLDLFAQWMPATNIVSFNANGGDGGMDNLELNTQASTNLPANSFQRAGYNFSGWNTSPTGGGTAYANQGSFTMPPDSVILYAQWTALSYSVSFNKLGGSSGTTSVVATFGSAMPFATAPSKAGYTFSGYFTEAEGSGTQYYSASMASTRSWDIAANTELVAKWTANTYTISFDQQSGTDGSSSVIASYGQAMPIATAPTRTGYTFGGYYTTSGGGGTQYYTAAMASAQNWNLTVDTTLYAKWTANTYTVSFDRQDGSGGSASVTASYDLAMPSATAPTRTGYTFGGYYSSSGGGGTQYYTAAMASAQNWNLAADTTLYAKWTANTYTVSFDQQDGSGGSDNVAATYGHAMPSATAPTRTGYTFGGYYTATGGGGTQYYTAAMASARTWDLTAATTLYAKWTANIYTVTFDKQSGTDGSSSVMATYGQAMPGATAPTRTGYTFGGYYTASDGGGTQYYTAAMASAQNWNLAADTTLYAKWTANTYTISFDQQSGTDGSSSVIATYGQAMPIATAPTRTGYTFGGYYTTSGGGGTQYYTAAMASARAWDLISDTTLYAKWTANTYTISFDQQSGTDGSSSVMATYALAMPSATAPTRTGYTFGGYYTATAGGGTQYYTAAMASARTWELTAATTLYAKWTANTYTVSFDQQSGSGGSSSVTATYALAMPSATAPTRTGYTFGGYYTATAGGGTQYYTAAMASARTWDLTAATTLYAKWTANTYTISFDQQDGSGGSASVTASYGQAMPGATAPTRTGYTFGGYYTATNGGDTQYYSPSMTSSQNWNLAATTTLYAKWTANNYTVSFDQQSGTDGSSSVMATYDQAMPSATAPTRTGYTFGGYYTTSGGGGTQYYTAAMASARAWDLISDTTLYAKWTASTYNIIFQPQDGSGTMANQAVDYQATVALSSNEFTRVNYSFAGWATSEGSTIVAYADGADYQHTITSDRNLYAIWRENLVVTIDLLNPEAIIIEFSNTAGTLSRSGTGYAKTMTVSATTGFDEYYWELDGEGTHAALTISPDGQGPQTVLIDAALTGSELHYGVHSLYLVVTDAKGLVLSCQFDFKVVE
jgi:uncharacterized repeat protein (TIGR02543 family)